MSLAKVCICIPFFQLIYVFHIKVILNSTWFCLTHPLVNVFVTVTLYPRGVLQIALRPICVIISHGRNFSAQRLSMGVAKVSWPHLIHGPSHKVNSAVGDRQSGGVRWPLPHRKSQKSLEMLSVCVNLTEICVEIAQDPKEGHGCLQYAQTRVQLSQVQMGDSVTADRQLWELGGTTITNSAFLYRRNIWQSHV